MFVHFFALHWKQGASQEQRVRALTEIRRLETCVPRIIALHVGENVSPASARYDLSGVVLFEDRAAFDAYQTNAQHLRLLDWLGPLVEPIEIDFLDATDPGGQ
jgi:hypothetical protein